MSIPDYQTIMKPLLEFSSDGDLHTLGDAVSAISERFELSSEERTRQLPSGNSTTIKNRVGWARTYLKMAGLLDLPERGKFRITPQGRHC